MSGSRPNSSARSDPPFTLIRKPRLSTAEASYVYIRILLQEFAHLFGKEAGLATGLFGIIIAGGGIDNTA